MSTKKIPYLNQENIEVLICARCKLEKSILDFYKCKSNYSGYYSYCKECEKNQSIVKREKSKSSRHRATLKYTYGITLKEIMNLKQLQDNKCNICDLDCLTLYVDHNQKCCSGKRSCTYCIRGLLCQSCNTGLGKFEDNVFYINNAIEYLTKSVCIIPNIPESKYHSIKEQTLWAQNWHLKRTYGINLNQYNYLVQDRNNKCDICKNIQTMSLRSASAKLYVDHEHINKNIRGLLCYKCNIGLGNFNDDIAVLKSAVDYIKADKNIMQSIKFAQQDF